MKAIFNFVVLVFLLSRLLSVTCNNNPKKIVINEFNILNVQKPEKNEFIELRSFHSEHTR